MEKTEKPQIYLLEEYPANSNGDQRPVLGCPVQGKLFDCRITLLTRQLGVIFSIFTYKDVAIKGSGLLNRLLSQMKANGPTSQVCNVDPIEKLLDINVPYQNGAVAWIFRYLQFSYDHPGDISFIKQLTSPSLRFDTAACISRLVDFLTVAHFFEVGPLQVGINRYLSSACRKFMQLHLLIFSKGPSGPLKFKQLVKVPGLLESTTHALIRAASIVPANSDMWFSTAVVYRTMRLVLESAGGGDQVTQQLLRLSSISAFASAWVRATCELKHSSLDGIFPQSPNWALQSTDCACSACTKRVWRRDLVERTPAEKAAGAVQKFALVNPYDGYKTVFCDYCLHNCGVPWGNGNKPRNPHE